MTVVAPRRVRIPPAAEGTLPLSEADFTRIARFANQDFGLHLQPGKKDLVQSRLTRILQQFGCHSISDLCDRLDANPLCPEREALISALTTNVTHFFRETHHFQLFSEKVLMPRLDVLRRGRRLRIWSAGCSAGQEPCSIAMTILEHIPDAQRHNIRILATDIDRAIVARARSFLYPAEEAEGIPRHLRRDMVVDAGAGQVQMVEKIRGMIHLAELNLIQSWPMRGPFDAIFCRNVAIYFDKPTQARLWERLSKMLSPGGYLFIGHSERVSGPATTRLISAGITSYRLSERTIHESERQSARDGG